MTKSICTSIVAFAMTALLIAGCGGSDDSTLSRAEFLKKADAICWKAHDKSFKGVTAYVIANGKNLSTSQPSQAIIGEAVATATVPAMQQGVKELEGLAAPEDEEEKVEKFVAAIEKANKTVEESPGNDDVASGAIYNDANKLAREYDFGRCESLP